MSYEERVDRALKKARSLYEWGAAWCGAFGVGLSVSFLLFHLERPAIGVALSVYAGVAFVLAIETLRQSMRAEEELKRIIMEEVRSDDATV